MTMDTDKVLALARWKKIPSFPDYEVSDNGLVRRGSRLLSVSFNIKGYPRVTMSINGKSISRVIHSLAAEAFIGPRPRGMQIRHLDGDKTNNSIQNLSYGTGSDNHADKVLHGRVSSGMRNGAWTMPERRPRGERHGSAKLTNCDVALIKKELVHKSHGDYARLARSYGVSESTIQRIHVGKMWGHL